MRGVISIKGLVQKMTASAKAVLGRNEDKQKKKMLDCPQFAARSDYSQEAVANMLLKKNEN